MFRGRLTTRTVGAVTETTSYNVRGWLTDKAAKKGTTNVFSMNLRYHDASTATDRWNGNISEWVWQQGTASSQTYRFAYDGVNRLTSALSTGNYNEKGITYDKNGNIKTMQRNAGSSTTMVDNLTYTYSGNKLTSLSEAVSGTPIGDIFTRGSVAAGSYTYDNNGNMVTDSRKNLQFSYNFLNLLGEVKSGSTVKAKYTWLADGSKLRVRNNSTTGFDYLGSLTYTSSSSGLTLETAQFAGGVIRSGNSQEINYFITDHLGSVRSIVNSAGTAVEQNDYYAFGAKHVRSNYAQNSNRFDFNGKEEQTTGNLKYLDYGARMYDNTIGRWFNVDPLAEKYYPLSPYNYALNNPVFFIDPDGMAADGYVVNPDGTFIWISPIGGNQYDVIYSIEGFWNALINMVMGNGFTTPDSIIISPEFLDNVDTFKITFRDEKGKVVDEVRNHYSELSNSEEASKLFEFLAKNTNVEWGHKIFERSSDGTITNVIITTHEEGRVSGLSEVYNRYFDKKGIIYDRFILNNHSHPSNELPSWGDKDMHKNIVRSFNSPDVKSNILFRNTYYEYNGKGLTGTRKKVR